MPTWQVSTPNLTLWLQDEPLGYQPAIGPRISFKLAYKQRESTVGTNASMFSVGLKWNLSWLSYVSLDSNSNKVVILPGGGKRTFTGTADYLTNTRLTGATTNGFTLSYPDGSKVVYGLLVTNGSGVFQNAFMTESWNPEGQKTAFRYYSYLPASPVIRLQYVVDGAGLTNKVFYVATNAFSTNLIGQVVDPFNRTNFLNYDALGRLTNSIDVAGLSSSFAYDSSNWISSITTPYGTTGFQLTESSATAPNGRSVLVTHPDGGKELYLYTNNAPSVASAYSTNEVPATTPFGNTFDNSELNLRNLFHWGPRQYAVLSTTNIPAFTADDFRKARMQHWLNTKLSAPGNTLSMERDPSPDAAGTIEGQKTWYDYSGKPNNAYEGTQSLPLFVARVLPDGTTSFTRTVRNGFGAVTNEITTYSGTSGTLLRTNIYTYATNEIDLFTVTNAAGVRVSSNWFNAFHLILTNFNALNERTDYLYDSTQRVIRVTYPTGLVLTNIYGANGFLAERRNVGISTNSFIYTNGLVLTQTDERGLTVTNLWDGLQRLVRTQFPDGSYISNRYTGLDLTAMRDRLGNWSYMGYDAERRKIAETNALGLYTLYNYCSCGSLDSIRDASGNYTYFFYDNAGRLTNTLYADNYAVTNFYDLAGRMVCAKDSAGVTATNWFNNQGLNYAVSNAFGRVFLNTYDALDRVTNFVDANAVSVATTYDNLNRVRTRTYPDTGVEAFGYTANFASATSYTNQLNNVVTYAYDLLQRKTNEVFVGITTNKFSYNAASDLLTLIDGKNQTNKWNYDAFGRVTNKIDAAGITNFVYKYDANNRLTNRWTPAKGNAAYTYDAVGNLTNIDYATSPDITLTYDALNRLTNMVDAVGTTKFSYTAVGQLLSEDGPWASDTVTYTYANRQRATLTLSQLTGSWTNGYTYDSANRLTGVTSPAGSFGYSYQLPTRISQLTLLGGNFITNSYDNMARLLSTTLKNSGGTVLNSHAYQLNKGNQRTNQTRISQVFSNNLLLSATNSVAYTYDAIGELKTAVGKEASGTNRWQEQLGYSYDAAGNLTFRTNNALIQTFRMNTLNQLTNVTRSGNATVAGGLSTLATNVTVNTSNALRYADASFAATNMALVNGTNTFTAIAKDIAGRVDTNIVTAYLPATNNYSYDQNGNLRTNGSQVLDYDDENQLIRVTVTNAWKCEFVYDGKFRRRVAKDFAWQGGAWTQTNETRFVYDGTTVIQERDSNNVVSVSYTRGLDLSGSLQGACGIGGLLARTTPNASVFYHADGNGNITALASVSGVVVARYLYDPFGNTLAMSGPLAEANVYRFSSKPIHAGLGWYDYLYRWYAPELQRFLNRDPIQEAGGINLFSLADNDLVNRTDSFGLLSNFGAFSKLAFHYLYGAGRTYHANGDWIDWIKSQPDVKAKALIVIQDGVRKAKAQCCAGKKSGAFGGTFDTQINPTSLVGDILNMGFLGINSHWRAVGSCDHIQVSATFNYSDEISLKPSWLQSDLFGHGPWPSADYTMHWQDNFVAVLAEISNTYGGMFDPKPQQFFFESSDWAGQYNFEFSSGKYPTPTMPTWPFD